MRSSTKIIFGVVVGALALCVCLGVGSVVLLGAGGAALARNFSDNPNRVADETARIVEFSPPAGWQPQASMGILGLRMVMYSGPADSFLMLIQFPPALAGNQEALITEMQRSAGRNAAKNSVYVGQRDVTIRGQAVTLTMREGTSESGELLRSLDGAFQGREGVAYLMLAGPVRAWEAGDIDALLATLQ